MQFDIQEMIQLAATQTPRLDLYAAIHKAIRALMCDTLLAVGRADPQDDTELVPVLDKVDELLTFCEHHVYHENTFVHPAIEARAPGVSDAVTAEHDAHLAHINTLRLATLATRRAPAAQRDAMTLALYRQLALFVADNFQHMHVEETAHNNALWQHYSDAELHATHQALVASIPPEEMMFTLRWMVPHMNAGERTMMMTDMQANAPAPAFAAAIDVVRPHLNASEWAKLARPLGLAPVPGLVR